MPNLAAHIELAHRAAQRLRHPILDADMGTFLLGSTSPDIRAITRKRREDYHFAPLHFGSVGEGTEGLFSAHPDLKSSSVQDGPTRAFVAGYISHLIVDETWIVDVFRPYFGNPGVFGDDATGKVMDRALQLELDRDARETVEATAADLSGATNGVSIDFIPRETMADWHHWVVTSLERGFSWERLRYMAKRIAGGDDDHPAHRIADRFLESMPESLEELHRIVPEDNLESFKERSVDALVRGVGDYLS